MHASAPLVHFLEINGNEYQVNEEGFLQNMSDWSREIAEGMAKKDGIELEPAHWEVINFLRDYYFEYQIAPSIRGLSKEIGKRLGTDGQGQYALPEPAVCVLNQLFAFGPARQACRYAGLPKPTGCV